MRPYTNQQLTSLTVELGGAVPPSETLTLALFVFKERPIFVR